MGIKKQKQIICRFCGKPINLKTDAWIKDKTYRGKNGELFADYYHTKCYKLQQEYIKKRDEYYRENIKRIVDWLWSRGVASPYYEDMLNKYNREVKNAHNK